MWGSLFFPFRRQADRQKAIGAESGRKKEKAGRKIAAFLYEFTEYITYDIIFQAEYFGSKVFQFEWKIDTIRSTTQSMSVCRAEVQKGTHRERCDAVPQRRSQLISKNNHSPCGGVSSYSAKLADGLPL